jgi:hypothetical protein
MKKTLGIISAVTLSAILLTTNVKDYRLNPNVTQQNIQQTICKSGWTKIIRPSASYTNKIKFEQLKSFSNKNPKDYEEDHRVSLELGGHPSDPHNLTPQPYENILDKVNLGAREKDIVESYLNREVCSGRMTLKDAQYKIISDWAEIYLKLKGYEVEPSVTDD